MILSIKLEKLKENIDRPLAAILSFNTIAHTVGAAGVGAQAAKVWGSDSLGVVSAVLTLLILIFSEIIPKTIGANYWRSLDSFAANVLNILIISLYPLVWLSMRITKLLSRKEKEAKVSRAEMAAMADIAQQEGIFKEMESKMIKNLIMLRNITVEDVMTPRTVIVMAKEDITVGQAHDNEEFERFSRVPVFSKNRDDISGYVHKLDMLSALADKKPDTLLKDIKRDIMIVANKLSLPRALDELMGNKEHVALVADRYGAVTGLVTMEDIIETLIGQEIVDEFDSVADMQEYAREQWRHRAERLGLVVQEEDAKDEPASETESTIKLGITGGQAPAGEKKASDA